jgi:hypothetical protein
MIICACDPDTQTPAFAIYNKTRLIHYDCLIPKLNHWVFNLDGIITMCKPELLVIEAQFIPPNAGGIRRFQSIAELCAARGMVQALFLVRGIPSVLIHPFQWQKSLGGSCKGREALKRSSQIKAADIAGAPIANINTADAICIGDWYVKTQLRQIDEKICHVAR